MQRYEQKLLNHPPKEVRYVGKCRACKSPVSALIPHAAYEAAYYSGGGKMYSSIFYRYDMYTSYGPLAAVRCECGGEVAMKPVKGTHNPDHLCDARCTGARGHNCECECGGVNHGSRWAA